MTRFRNSRIYLVYCAAGGAAPDPAGRSGRRARYALSLNARGREKRATATRGKSVFDTVEGGCLSLKRT